MVTCGESGLLVENLFENLEGLNKLVFLETLFKMFSLLLVNIPLLMILLMLDMLVQLLIRQNIALKTTPLLTFHESLELMDFVQFQF